MFKTTIMVNKREKIYYIISISDKRLSYFFISLILTLSFYSFLLFFTLFQFNFVVSERNVHILILPTYLGGTFFPLLDISERNFFPRWGVHVHPVHPPAYVPVFCGNSSNVFPINFNFIYSILSA